MADDDETDRMLFRDAFSELTFNTEITFVNNGVELMTYLSNNENKLPDLLFLDLNMPQKDGMQCLKEIKANEIFKNIAIAIYSTSGTESDIEETFLKGANIYIQKPVDFSALKEMLKRAVISTQIYQTAPFNRANFLLRL